MNRAQQIDDVLERGRAKYDAGDFAGARACFAEAKTRQPTATEPAARYAATCAALADWPAAEMAWREVLALQPNFAVALTGIGIALREQGRGAEAVTEFSRLAADRPELAAAHFNLGTCLLDTGRPAEAVGAFRTALTLDPTSGDSRFNLALALLKSGSFRTGALAYEARWKSEWRGKERPFAMPRWTGRPLAVGQSLLLWGEQGIGDEIMFAGLIPKAATTAAGPILLECAPRLVPLFARSFPEVTVVARTDPPAAALREASLQAPVGTLPGLFWPAERPPEPPAAYLHADPRAVTAFRAHLATSGAAPKIGVAWRGGHPAGHRARVVPVPVWRELVAQADFVPVCLQHGMIEPEVAAVFREAGRPLVHFADADPLVDMDAFAALIAALDGVVSVDNSTVHLAGALGAPAVVLLATDNDWRWGIDGVPCPWYRSVERTRQQVLADWGPAPTTAARFIGSVASHQ